MGFIENKQKKAYRPKQENEKKLNIYLKNKSKDGKRNN
jgi:hypothetical protein